MFIGSFYRKRQLHFIVSNHCFRRRGEEYVSESDNSPRERPIVAAITSALNLLAIYKMKGECLLCWIWPTWWMPARQGHFFLLLQHPSFAFGIVHQNLRHNKSKYITVPKKSTIQGLQRAKHEYGDRLSIPILKVNLWQPGTSAMASKCEMLWSK